MAASTVVVASGASPASAATRRATKYAFSATGFGTYVTSTNAALSSGRTAYSLIGCTKLAGIHNANTVSSSNPNDQVHVGSVNTSQRSTVTKAGSSVVTSVTKVSRIDLGDSTLGFRITNLAGTSRAYANKKGKFNAASTFSFGSLQPLGGTSLPPPLDQPADVILQQLKANGPVTIPGLGIVQLGHVGKSVGKYGAQSGSIGLQVLMFGQDQARGGGDDSNVLIGRTYARITKLAPHGVFSGGTWGMDGTQLDGTVALGRNPFTPMQCEGTRGKVKTSSASDLNLANLNQLLVGSVKNRVFGVQNTPTGGATGWTESSANGFNLGGGQLRMNGVLARAKVVRTKTNHYRIVAIQQIGSITANGTAQPVPQPGQTLTIPGVAKIAVPRPVKTARGVTVIGARVTLLGGSAANTVLNIATAKLQVRAQ